MGIPSQLVQGLRFFADNQADYRISRLRDRTFLVRKINKQNSLTISGNFSGVTWWYILLMKARRFPNNPSISLVNSNSRFL
ncbi:MAG TPA: hypothetical protein DEP08_01295 [Candidatus Jacksonbacteria bacterium]|nr:hypothetical protein [Candidatus Jacksonbacteria bacterium]